MDGLADGASDPDGLVDLESNATTDEDDGQVLLVEQEELESADEDPWESDEDE